MPTLATPGHKPRANQVVQNKVPGCKSKRNATDVIRQAGINQFKTRKIEQSLTTANLGSICGEGGEKLTKSGGLSAPD